MAHRRIMVLGGYGRAGYCTAQTLLCATDTTTVIVAGRHQQKAQSAAHRLRAGGRFDHRVEVRQVDADRYASLCRAFGACDVAVVAMPYREGTAQRVIDAALEAHVDYLDLNADTAAHALLRDRASQIRTQGRVFLTDGGIVPGCPSILLRWAHDRFDRLDDVQIASIYRDPDMPHGSAADIVAHASTTPHAYRDGTWRAVSSLNVERISFGPLGHRLSAPVELPELIWLPDDLRPAALAAYQGGINPVVNGLLLLWGLTGLGRTTWGRQLGVNLFQWANRAFTAPPYGIVLQLVATGLRNGRSVEKRIRLYHEDVYRATAIPVVAALQQMMAGDLAPGPAFMGHAVEPAAFRRQVERLGMVVDGISEH